VCGRSTSGCVYIHVATPPKDMTLPLVCPEVRLCPILGFVFLIPDMKMLLFYTEKYIGINLIIMLVVSMFWPDIRN
jgi:hypothetical protein